MRDKGLPQEWLHLDGMGKGNGTSAGAIRFDRIAAPRLSPWPANTKARAQWRGPRKTLAVAAGQLLRSERTNSPSPPTISTRMMIRFSSDMVRIVMLRLMMTPKMMAASEPPARIQPHTDRAL